MRDFVLHGSIERTAPSFTARPASSLRVRELDVITPMHEQLHAPIENATTLPNRYPAEPAAALTASIEARRNFLLGRYDETESHAHRVTLDIERIGAFEPEVRR